VVSAALPADQRLAAQRCASCPKMCRGVCPTLEVTRNERHQPWGHAREDVAAQRSAEGGGEGFAGGAVAESAYACATCAACTVPCEVEGVETPELVWAVRAAVWAAGAAPAIAVEAVRQAEAGLVPAGEDPPRWVDPATILAELRALATPGAAVLLVPGCGALGRRPAAVLAAGRALRALGVGFRVPDEHRCCGAVARAAGDAEGALRGAQAVGAQSAGGTERIAVHSPSCAAHLVRSGTAGVVALADVFAEALATAPRPASAGVVSAVAYHDPCMLARHLDVRDTPRAALRAAGAEVTELARHGGATRCSGRGGLLSLTHPEIARGYLDLLAADVREAGIQRLVTGCASCASALEAVLPEMDVADLAEAVATALVAP
jgi:heterodisulfide reductase subunit D